MAIFIGADFCGLTEAIIYNSRVATLLFPRGHKLIIWEGFKVTLTLPETNMAPENWWLEYYFPFGARPAFRGFGVLIDWTCRNVDFV